jgi:hypothetical protein
MTAIAATVRERPILFSGPMVRAILEGKKTQTRRVLRPQPAPNTHMVQWNSAEEAYVPWRDSPVGAGWWRTGPLHLCPYGVVGDRLWVRETHAVLDITTDTTQAKSVRPSTPWTACVTSPDGDEWYVLPLDPSEWRESFYNDHVQWRPSIHMPRWASRLTLEVTGVRVERLHEIDNPLAEGVECHVGGKEHERIASSRQVFHNLWDSLNAKRGFGWDVNPWVWVLEFKPCTTDCTTSDISASHEDAPL